MVFWRKICLNSISTFLYNDHPEEDHMKFRSLMTAICVLATANIVAAAPFAYIANSGTNNVSVINTADNTIAATVTLPAGTQPYPYSVAVSPSGQYVYVGIQGTKRISIIDAATNTLLPQTISLGGDSPGGLAINAAETRLYVASNQSNTLIVIDITNIKTGSGPISEVGRVTVHSDSISNPEGVAILSDVTGKSLKAYVANSTKGSIAEISLDETNNLYIRTNLIALGSNGQPMGLALNSDGSRLYVASLNGHASVINTTDRTVTDLPLGGGDPFELNGTGNLSVAITPDDSKIYAPSAGFNNMYAINGTNNSVTELGLQNSLLNSPWGSSVAPVTPNTNPTKLYVAMNLSNDVKVFNTADNSLLTTINLVPTAGAGAKPTSMGDFIGPEFPYTITSAAQTGCTIAPLGIIPVTDLGRAFSINAQSGQCEVFTGTTSCSPTRVGGTSQGFPTNYNYANGAANGTICAENKTAGTYYTLSGDWISSVGGCLQSDVAHPGINCGSKSADYSAGSIVTLSATPGFGVQSGTWAGVCAGSASTCTITMDADKSFGTTTVIILGGIGGKVKNETKSSYHETCEAATAAATTGDYIKVSTAISYMTTTGTPGVTVTVSSQWNKDDFTQKATTPPYASLALTITDVAVIANDLVL